MKWYEPGYEECLTKIEEEVSTYENENEDFEFNSSLDKTVHPIVEQWPRKKIECFDTWREEGFCTSYELYKACPDSYTLSHMYRLVKEFKTISAPVLVAA